MNNLEITVCVIAIAVAQVLTIFLTIGRERDIKELREIVSELRELVDQQRLRIVELRAWLAGRNAALPPPSRIKSESEPIREPIANNIKAPEPAIIPKDLPETMQPLASEDEAAQFDQAGSGVSSPPGRVQWPIEDLHRYVARLKEGALPEPATPKVPEPAITRKDLPDTAPLSTTRDDLERTTKAINWLKEDADKAREIGANLDNPPAEKKTG
ncbi:MAG TPA: hypothetical protein VE111_12150 [Bradyrhizobium sp.]|nr:hypothetical protein [Bradyrhizobium sp.]